MKEETIITKKAKETKEGTEDARFRCADSTSVNLQKEG